MWINRERDREIEREILIVKNILYNQRPPHEIAIESGTTRMMMDIKSTVQG